jgi:hypothetical protein
MLGKFTRQWLTALIMFMSVASAMAQTVKVGTIDKTPAIEFDQKRFEALRAEGFEALYNLDYERARGRFKEIARLYPDHPAGPQFIAASLWLKTLNESRRLQASLYNTEGFYKEKDDKADPKLVAEFRELTRQAKTLCEARLKRDPKDVEALYYLGAVEGLKAAFGAMVERSFMSSLRNGSDAVDHHRAVVKLDPNYHDARITIGTYEYVTGTLPLPIKLMAAIGGIRGSRKKGLASLEQAAREGRWARDDAKTVLIALYKREKRYMDAYAMANDLALKYPRNYLLKMEAADALVSHAAEARATNPEAAKKSEQEAFAIFESLVRGDAKGAPRPPLDLVHYSYGEALFVAGEAERAAKEFLSSAAAPNAEASMVTRAKLRAAQALDVAGKRDEALAQYKAVLARPNVYDSHEDAKRGLKEPYKTPRGVAADASAGSDIETDATKAVKP